LLIRGRTFATFPTIEKALVGLEKTFCRPLVVQGFRMSAMDWSEWRWAFSFYVYMGVETGAGGSWPPWIFKSIAKQVVYFVSSLKN